VDEPDEYWVVLNAIVRRIQGGQSTYRGIARAYGVEQSELISRLEAAPIGGQLFAHETSQTDCKAFLPFLVTKATRLLVQALRHFRHQKRKA
jgi:hypothetical protein